MEIKNISVNNFRNIESLFLEFDSGTNIFCGQNGMGKTNLLEAVWMLCGEKSFRGNKDLDLIMKGKEKSIISAEIESLGTKKDISLVISEKRTASALSKPLKSPHELSEFFNASVFSPIDLNLMSDGPKIRRKFMDTTLCQLFPKYNSALRLYKRALEQRNAVLRDARYHREIEGMLYPIEFNMERAAEVIIAYRKRLVEHYCDILPEFYEKMAGKKEKVHIKYIEKAEGSLSAELEKSRKEDILSGNTSVGPHRDDIMILINGEDTRNFASQGQKRSAALSLKLSEAALIERVRGEKPVILLDDVMSELDNSRQSGLIKAVEGSQVFITCCDKNNINALKDGKVFNIEEGRIV